MKVPWVPLGEVLTPKSGEPVDPSGTYPIAGVYGFARGVLLRDSIAGHETKYKSLTRLSSGDVVYSKLGAFEGAVAVVREAAERYFVSPEFPVFKPTKSINPQYLSQVLATPKFLLDLATKSTGIGARQKRVHPEQFLSLRIPLPLCPEQDRIAAYLDSLARVQVAIAKSRELRASDLINRLVMLTAQGAKRVPIALLLERDRTWIDIDQDAIYKPVGISGFGRGMIRYPSTTGDNLSKLRYYRLTPGDLLISNIKAWEGAVCLVGDTDDVRIASNRFLQYRPSENPLDLAWIYRYLLTPEGTALLGKASPGSADRNRTLSMDSFEEIEIPMPDPPLRQKLVTAAAYLERIAAVENRRDSLRAAILPAARNEIFSAIR